MICPCCMRSCDSLCSLSRLLCPTIVAWAGTVETATPAAEKAARPARPATETATLKEVRIANSWVDSLPVRNMRLHEGAYEAARGLRGLRYRNGRPRSAVRLFLMTVTRIAGGGVSNRSSDQASLGTDR